MTFEGRRNRKHLARKQREERLRRYLIIGVAIVAVAVVGVIGYGWYDVNIRQPNRPIITVEGVQISQESFRARVRLLQGQLMNQLSSTQQLTSFFGNDPDVMAQLNQDMQRIESQLQNPIILGQQTIEQMVREVLIEQEAERRGLSVTEAEVDALIQESFGYYPEGTPTPGPTNTPRPTGTIDPTAQAAVTPTETATAGPTPTITLTPSPQPSATPYTQELYEQDYQAYMDQLAADEISEKDFRGVVRAELYRQKLQQAFEDEVSHTQEQVHARHILVEEESTAQEVLDLLEQGDSFEDLAAEYSIDESNKDEAGDLGWFGRGRMVEPFEEAAFNAEVGEIVGPVETSFGFHIIEVLEHEDRELSDQEYQQAVETAMQQWLTEVRRETQVDVLDAWTQIVPIAPGYGSLDQPQQALP
jgi:hypothetical protein